jgi:Na+-transporting methylmalonyl-CoA/oxaloacetate decarboxylase gamma subunit
MQSLLIFADTAVAAQTKTEGIGGLPVLLIILALLAVVLFVLLFVFKQPSKAARPAAASAPASAPADIPAAHAKVVVAAALHTALKDNSLLPVILAAAAEAVCGAPKALSLSLRPTDSSWSLEGRRAIFASHTLRK